MIKSSMLRAEKGRAVRRRAGRPLQTPDTHSQPAETTVMAGVTNLQVLYRGGEWTLPITLTITVSTGSHRGVHMSRLVDAAQRNASGGRIEEALARMRREVDETQPGCEVVCRLSYPYKDQFMPIEIRMEGDGLIHYVFNVKGVTACPCSKEAVGIGHMQRSTLTMRIAGREPLDFEVVAQSMLDCFSAELEEKLKRPDEGRKILEAQEKPRFVEDIVRECVKRFPGAEYVEGRAEESIHIHDAIAFYRKPSPA